MAKKNLQSIEWDSVVAKSKPTSLMDLIPADSKNSVERWFETLLAISQTHRGEGNFAKNAALAVVELIGLDGGLVMLYNSGVWSVAGIASKSGVSIESYCPTIFERIVESRATFFESHVMLESSDDPSQVQAVVASPILDSAGTVVGALCGAKRLAADRTEGIHRLEARVVQFLAAVIGAGLIAENRQADASRFQMQLEQFASPSLVRAMKDDPSILDAREREITVLFSDIRGFTGLTERVGAEKTFVMIRNLMNQLTRCILDENGFIMGYAGDGLAAMWNAPANQQDHAELACWAAINMQREMAKLSQFWNFITGEVLEARIGISTGIAHVGNAGSRWRMNYSALGPYVNLASRLEGANKFFGTSILISQSTKERLFSSLELRRIGPVLVKGVDQIEQVYELRLDSKSNSAPCFADYEQALQLFEQSRFRLASKVIEESQSRCGDGDMAMRVLKNQIDSLDASAYQGAPAIRLPTK